jgi:AcrR family transcriptional regulator
MGTIDERVASPEEMGLRERKKVRTRQTIERVALELFAKQGFQATTLAEIADAAEIAPSTLYAYFPLKEDILFGLNDAVRESAKRRIIDRPKPETLVDALAAWITTEVPALVGSDSELMRRRRAIIDEDDSLLVQERLRNALLEDVFAEAFAQDLGETSEDLRSRLMAAVAVSGLRAIWFWWYRRRDQRDIDDMSQPYALDATYLTELLSAAEAAVEAIPTPAERFPRA